MLWLTISSLAIVSMWTLAGLSALSAARTARTPQGAIGWVVFLLSAPMIALPAYLFFGHYRFSDYHSRRKEVHDLVRLGPDRATNHTYDRAKLSINPAPFEAVSGLGVANGNDYEILIDGEACFAAILTALDQAEHYILVQFYTVRDDGLGQQLQSRLLAAARRGVTIWFMIDNVGSHGLSRSYLRTLEQAGVNLVDPKTSRGPKHRFHINFRNHRKSVIVDGRVGFTGGLNVGDEYLGLDPKFGHWRDTHLRLMGPMVQQLQISFAEDWHWLTEEPITDLLQWVPEPASRDTVGLVVPTGPGDTTENGSMLFFSAISAASEHIWITSPYFVPDLDVVAALKHAALRGVDVRILVPDKIDHFLPWLAAFSYFDDLRQAGVAIYRYTDGFMHQKVFVVDDALVGIGTTNLDNRSFRLNFETMALLFNQEAARTMMAVLTEDFSKSYVLNKNLEQQDWHIRMLAPVARLLAPVL